MLLTKSVQAKAEDSDGIRICIMRRIKPEFQFDMWMPTLAPSTELLKSYHDKEISWQQYEVLYKEQVLNTQRQYLDILAELARKHTTTILCWEETPQMCHRRLTAERIASHYPDIDVKIR